MLVSIILLQVSSIWTTIFLCSSGVFTHLICVLAVLHWTEMLVVHIEQAVRQWYETSYYYLGPGGSGRGLDLSGVTASHKFILTTKLAAVRHLFDQRSMIIDSAQYKLSSYPAMTDFYLPARSQWGTALIHGAICLSRISQNIMKIILLSPEGGGRMFLHASQLNEIQPHFLDLIWSLRGSRTIKSVVIVLVNNRSLHGLLWPGVFYDLPRWDFLDVFISFM